MGADFSKVRSNPLLDYAGVELKQGAVLLDADANELVAIVDRRLRALAGDVLGRATVGANTPDAFRITLGTTSTGAQTLLIGPGRLYVDGLLAENHGNAGSRAARVRCPDGRTGLQPSPCLTKRSPIYPIRRRCRARAGTWCTSTSGTARSRISSARNWWRRAVGVETSSRLQTVWQVRVLGEEAGSGTTCGSPDAELAGLGRSHRAFDRAPDYRHLRGRRGDRSLRAATHGRLPRAREPALPRRDPRSGPARRHGHVQVVARQRQRRQPRGRLHLGVRARSSTLSAATKCCASTAATGWRSSTTCASSRSAAARSRRITVEANKDRHITLNAPLPAEMLPGAFPDSDFPRQRNLRVRLLEPARRGAVHGRQRHDGAYSRIWTTPASTGVIKVPAAGTTLLLENGVTVSFSDAGPQGLSRRRLLGVRRAHRGCVGGDARPGAAARHSSSLCAAESLGCGHEHRAHRLPPPLAADGGGDDCACTQCVTPESHASGQLTIEEAVQPRAAKPVARCACKAGRIRAAPRGAQSTSARSVRIRGEGDNDHAAGARRRVRHRHRHRGRHRKPLDDHHGQSTRDLGALRHGHLAARPIHHRRQSAGAGVGHRAFGRGTRPVDLRQLDLRALRHPRARSCGSASRSLPDHGGACASRTTCSCPSARPSPSPVSSGTSRTRSSAATGFRAAARPASP